MSIYDRLGPYYDLLTASERPYRRLAADLLELQAGETLLEIGCGTGQSLLELAQHADGAARLVGLDLSRSMLVAAQHNLRQAEETAVALLRGNGLALPLSTGCCDAAFLSFTLELFDLHEQHRLLGELRRVLKEDGRLALVTLSTHVETPVSSLYWSLHELFPGVVDCRPIDAPALLAAAGFSITRLEQRSLFGLPLAILLAVPA